MESAQARKAQEATKPTHAAPDTAPKSASDHTADSGALTGMPLFLQRSATDTLSAIQPAIQRQADEPKEISKGIPEEISEEIPEDLLEEDLAPEETVQTQLISPASPPPIQRECAECAEAEAEPILPEVIQAKLIIGAPNDKYEQEADQVADQVIQMPDASTPQMGENEELNREENPEENKIQTKPISASITPLVQREVQRSANSSAQADSSIENQLKTSKGGGNPLPKEVRSFMEPRFGADFSQVRVHTDETAAQMNQAVQAKAFNHGQDIYFNKGYYNPDSTEGKQLLAHELTHTIQQTGQLKKSSLPQTVLEGETQFTLPVEQQELPGELSGESGAIANTELPSSPTEKLFNQQPTAPNSNSIPPITKSFDSIQPPATATQQNAIQPKLFSAPSSPLASPPSIGESFSGSFGGSFGESFGGSFGESLDGSFDESFDNQLPIDTSAPQLQTKLLTSNNNLPSSYISLSSEPTNFIQREDEDSGFFARIQRLINSIVEGMRSGWNSLSQMASSAFESLQSQFSSLAQELGTLVTDALSGIQNGWSELSQLATQLTNSIQQQLSNAIGTIIGAVSDIGQAIINLDAAALTAAFNRVTGLIGSVFGQLQQAGQAVLERVTGLWNSLQGRFNAVLENLANRASEIFNQIQTAVESIHQRLSAVWDTLQNRAAQMSGILGGVLERLSSLVDQLLAWRQQIWSGIQQQWATVQTYLSNLFQSIRQRVIDVLQSLRQQAIALWQQVTDLWTRLSQWVQQQIQNVINGVRSIWTSLQNLSISDLVEKILALSNLYELIQDLATNIRAYATPIAQDATDRVFSAMPDSALGFAQEKMSQAGISSTSAERGSETATPEAATPEATTSKTTTTREVTKETTDDTLIQRSPLSAPGSTRSTASFQNIADGFELSIRALWRGLTPSAFLDMLLNAVLEQLFPPLAVYRQLRAFVTEDLAHLVSGLYMPRNLLDRPLDALHDIYSNILHFVSDFVLALLRRLANILMSFQLWITIALTALGAAGGATVVGILGGILAGLASFGIGAGAGAAGGAAAGGAAGAGIGFGVSLLIGEAIFFALLAIHSVTIIELLLELTTTLQTDEEKRRDYAQLAESSITVGVGLALLLLAWLAGVAAKGIGSLFKGVKVELPPALSRFLRGAGSVNKPPPGTAPPRVIAAALAAEQRLSSQIGGALARRLVADLGPELAEQVVARLGRESTIRLSAELTSQQMATLANSGLRVSAIEAALNAGQARRLAALSPEQLTRFAALSDNGFARIISLPEGQFQRFANLGEAQLRLFSEMERTAFNRFAALDDGLFSRFRTLSPDRIEAFSRLSGPAFNRYTALDPATFAKFERLSPSALERFGGISDSAFARFATLDQAILEKFSNVSTPSLDRFGTMDSARFNVFAQAQQATIEKFAALSDTAFNRLGGINYTANELEKLGTLDSTILENLATVPDRGQLIFLTKQLNGSALANIGQLSTAEIDSLLTRLGTSPTRLNTLGTLSVVELRNFLAIRDTALLTRFANLPATEIAAFRALSTAELENLAQVGATNLPKFARLTPAGLRNLLTLAPEQIATLSRLTDAQLNIWASVQPSTLAQFVSRDVLTLSKLADGAGVAGIERLASLSPRFVQEFTLLDTAAMQRYLGLPPADLAKFDGMNAFNMQQLANRPPGELEALAATRSAAELLAEAGDTPAQQAANRAAVLALDDPTINPATGRARGHASEHSAGTNLSPTGTGLSPVEIRLRTGMTTGGVIGPIPPEVSVFASEAVQLEAVRLGRANLQAEIAAGRPLGTGTNGRHTFATTEGTAPPLEGAGFSFKLEGFTVDPATGNRIGGTMVQQQVGGFRIVFEPTVPAPTSVADYRIVTMFPE